MKVIDKLKDFFFGTDKAVAHPGDSTFQSGAILAFEEFYVNLAINMIAGAIGKCEFRTFKAGKPYKAEEYYLWNYEPNANQNSTQFIQELVAKVLKYNEALVVDVNGKLIIADSFTRDEHEIGEDVFRDVWRGGAFLPGAYMARDVLYFQNANENIRQLLSTISAGYSELLNLAVGKYRRAGGRKGVVRLAKGATGNSKADEAMDDLFNKKFKKYFTEENAVLQLPAGVDYDEIHGEGSKKSTSELTDITNLMEEAASAVGLAFKIPPAMLLGKIADVDKLTENFLTFCIDPIADSISEEITRKRYGFNGYRAGDYLSVDTSCIRHVDVFSAAPQVDKLIACGMYSIDELREKIGEYRLNTNWSKKHWRTKNYDDIMEGG